MPKLLGAACDYIQALLCPVERKNGWQMSEQVGYANPYRLQHLLGRAQSDAERVCAELRDYVVEHLDDGAGASHFCKNIPVGQD